MILNIDLDKRHTPIQLLRMILARVGYKVEYVGRYGSRDDRHRYYQIHDCISNELWDEIFKGWSFSELSETQQFQNQQQQVA